MEFSWKTVMILLGLLAVVVIVLDGIRRMRKARAEALRIDISNDFSFPDDDHNPELPGGGYRKLGDRTPEEETSEPNTSRAPRAEPDRSGHMATVKASVTGSDVASGNSMTTASAGLDNGPASGPGSGFDESGFDELGEVRVRSASAASESTVFSAANIKDHQGDHIDQPAGDTLGNPLNSELQMPSADELSRPAPTEIEMPLSPESFQNDHQQQTTDEPWGASRIDDSQMQDSIESWLHTNSKEIQQELEPLQQPAAIIPTAKPVDLDEEVPLLMSVETLGDREVVIDTSASRDDDGHADKATPGMSSKDTRDDSPAAAQRDLLADVEADLSAHLEEEIEQQEEQGKDVGSELIIYAGDDAECLSDRAQAEVVLVIHAVSRDADGFSGRSLLHLFDGCDLRFGSEKIFHRYEEADGKGPIQFSVAQTYEPGIFNPATMEDSQFAGLTFFMSLPGAGRPLEAYQAMSEMARVLADHLNAELRDGSQSTFTRQTVEHDRQHIMEYERRKTLQAKKKAKQKR